MFDRNIRVVCVDSNVIVANTFNRKFQAEDLNLATSGTSENSLFIKNVYKKTFFKMVLNKKSNIIISFLLGI